MRVFSACSILTRIFFGNFPQGKPSKEYSNSNILNYEVLLNCTTKKKIHLVDIGSANLFLQTLTSTM
jgi:hypothetical protein